jgi:hypothetical protein
MSERDTSVIQYYFCVVFDNEYWITPKEHFDKKGYLLDSGSFDPKIPGFERVADSTFQYFGSDEPVDLLLKDGRFMWRDMHNEILMMYRRRRLLGIDNQE